MNLYSAFERAFPQNRSALFLKEPQGRVLSYGDLEEQSGRIARVLMDCGVTPGDRVAVQVEKSPEAVMLYLACLRVRAVYLPLNPAYTPTEVSYFLGDAEPRVFVGTPEREESLAPIAREAGAAHLLTLGTGGNGSLMDRMRSASPMEPGALSAEPEDLAAILYTSGTTGRSKGAMISHGNLLANARTLHQIWGFTPTYRLIHALPIYHTHGLFVALNTSLLNGTGMVFLRKFDASAILDAMGEGTVLMGVPTFYVRLLENDRLSPESCAHMRLFISGSAPLLEETFRAFETRTGQRILERYGMTETNMLTSNPLNGERRLGSVGPALPDVRVRITEGGKILGPGETGGVEVQGPNVFGGYWKMPEKTAEDFTADGYFKTGDMGMLSGDGYLTLVGRAKDLIISGGFNVYPKEVELLIDDIPGVTESAVIGVPHKDFGEGVVAVVVADGSVTVDEARILTALADKLAKYKQPKRVFLVEALPRNAMGKVQKNLLRDQYWDVFA